MCQKFYPDPVGLAEGLTKIKVAYILTASGVHDLRLPASIGGLARTKIGLECAQR